MESRPGRTINVIKLWLARNPTSLKFHKVRDSVVRGINSVNSKMFHLNLHKCENVLLKNVDIIAPVDSPNTDGIHIGKSNGIAITASRISTGDDCISMGDGSTNISITSVWCGPGHTGLASEA
ncbi:UNVERIFIED_CONTAM: Exopolygalacturonase [Sesamum radiatum]|uniref:Exopolygalacturonase n=1 Tax=Sesamum radiatum TaxID=300843 RepID=A0AAW2INE1_SESRA